MGKKRGTRVTELIADRLTPEWKLLSETESFLSHTSEFPAYERQFTEWRAALQSRDEDRSGNVRAQLIALRRELRLSGYDLSLGRLRLEVSGFRNDDCMAQGFSRVVICFAKQGLFYRTGSGNHIELGAELEQTLVRQGLAENCEYHYLWYLRTARSLTLSGSATETKEAFRRLAERAAANPLRILSALKDLW